MTDSLVAMYGRGAITADQLVIECLNRIDPIDPGPVLEALPVEILFGVLDFARTYRSGDMITNYGVLPTIDQVEAARRWIEGSRSPVGVRATPIEHSKRSATSTVTSSPSAREQGDEDV